jgi:hypothetical protein
MRKILLFVILLPLAAAVPGRSQKLADQPGYLPIEQLDLFPREKLSLEINFQGAILRLIAAAAKIEDPEFASLMAGLKAITVQTAPLKELDEKSVRAGIGRTVRWLEDHGWSSTMRVREEGEETYIYLKETDGKISGLTLLAFDPQDEAVVINIVGRIDPAQIGRLSERLHIEQLNKVPPSGKKPE